MKRQLKIMTLMTLGLASFMAMAEGTASKSNLRVDFNKLIEDNNVQRKNLHQDIDADTAAPKKQVALKKSDKGKTIDFIDVEIGVGQAPALTDRRFDSVGEARPADENLN